MSRRRTSAVRLPRRPGQAALFLIVVAAVVAFQRWHAPSTPQESSSPVDAATHRVARVVDGDTLVLAETKEKVRLIGTNTPETVKPNCPVEPWGPEASAFTREFLAGGEVRLEFDGDRRDKYGRLLAYVWCGDRMLNEELIREGLARAELKYHYSAAMKERFRRAEAEAKAERRGIWSGRKQKTADNQR